MKHLFVNYDLATKLKQKGFNEKCFAWYNCGDTIEYFGDDRILDSYAGEEDRPFAPLYQQIIDWFEEKHKIFIMMYPRDGWNFMVQGIDETISCSGDSKHGTGTSKKEVTDKAIEEALKLI